MVIVNETGRRVLFLAAGLSTLTPWISAPVALLLGLLVAQTIGNPYLARSKRLTPLLLQISVVGLGFGMNVEQALEAGRSGFVFASATIIGTMLVGTLLGRLFKMERKTTHLVSAGTAICGGSAIAAVSPVIRAEDHQTSAALGIVFILNSVALFLFPVVGHMLQLSQAQFGMWAAIAIHDTSSVVGAASSYGAEALGIATTVKLTRALWIIPLALASVMFFKSTTQRIRIPWFIGFYIVAMILYTYVPIAHSIGPIIVNIAKSGLTLTLFLIGSNLSRATLVSVGIKPFILGIILWVVISVTSLVVILY